MKKRMHLSSDNQYRDCSAKSEESCTAKGANGEKAEHIYFNSSENIVAVIEKENAQGNGNISTIKGKGLATRRSSEVSDQVFDSCGKYQAKRETNPTLGGHRWLFRFDNGYTASVIKHRHSYGGDKGLYELAVLRNGVLVYDTPITDDVLGHLTWGDVANLLDDVAALPKSNK